ncbi:hypothetical protein OSTOST_20872, partial [Ostertagia ostertagi]
RDPSTGRAPCLGKPAHFRCDDQSEQFLDALQRALQQGVAGASTFRAEAALVVTWKNMRPNIGSELGLSTYQLVWMSDAQGLLSYTMINYYKLGFDAADMYGNSRYLPMVVITRAPYRLISQKLPSNNRRHSLRDPRYRILQEEVPLLIYPNIVTMLGQTKVDVNGMCLNPAITYVLMIEQR